MPIISEKSVLGSNSYEAYLYKFVNLVNLKTYIGVHKGSANDEYLHSSTNEEFKEALQQDDVFTDAGSARPFGSCRLPTLG